MFAVLVAGGSLTSNRTDLPRSHCQPPTLTSSFRSVTRLILALSVGPVTARWAHVLRQKEGRVRGGGRERGRRKTERGIERQREITKSHGLKKKVTAE